MSVRIDESGRLFTIHTCHTTYQMKADDKGVLLHLYYGARTAGSVPEQPDLQNICSRIRTADLRQTPLMPVWTGHILWMYFPRNFRYQEPGICAALR